MTDYFNIPRKYPSLNSGKITSLTTLILLLILTCFTSQVTAESMTQLLERQSPTELAQAARLQGDASRGAVLFFQPYMSCAKCHDADSGISLGPDISKSGKETTAEHLIESLLAPSKVIKKGYETLSVQTVDGKVISGFMHEEKDGFLTLTDPAGGKQVKIPIADIEQRSISTKSLMPEGLINQLSDRQQFLDLTKYLIEIAAGGPVRAKDLRPAQTVFTLPEYEKHIDHAGLLNKLDNESFARGEVIYSRVCANCHGTLDMPGSLPTSPKFANHVFKNGSDPYSLYQTLTRGYNLMAPQTWMVPQQKYDVIYYLRETYLKKHNPGQFVNVEDSYLAKLPQGKPGEFGPEPVKVEPWVAMDYGPSLMNTYEIGGGPTNIAYKGIAVRLDGGTGGVSRGNSWAIFDHDTLRYAAGWQGTGFIDWRGIHFDGEHQKHPKIVGDVQISTPVGPGWADPETGSFADPRFLGRDERPYGPLPRKWGQFRGIYAYGDQTVISYTVGDASILELEGTESDPQSKSRIFTRTLEIGKSSRDLLTRLAGDDVVVGLINSKPATVEKQNGFQVLNIPAASTPLRVKILMAKITPEQMKIHVTSSTKPQPLNSFITGGPKRWPQALNSTVTTGSNAGPFSVDTFGLPELNPWNALLRLTGFDFYPDGKRMAVCTWDGDVWEVGGIDHPENGLTWQRIATGMFQPLGLKFRGDEIFVCCRDQIIKLKDLNGDGETDFYECFNNDHQVTEHFHEFAMGLQTDTEGNFYYAKSGRHALDALVPHHGTLLKVSRDGSTTDILATGFRAANGVCLNPDGTFFVTDQEGFWTPKNRINRVEKGGFYGNMWGYTDIKDNSDSAMKQPLCWITNKFDRSPAELIWVPENTWGPLGGSLLNTSYGMGQIFVVPHETVAGQTQGGVNALPIPKLPTGVMRPRFHPGNGQLYVCGMFAWAGNQVAPGGFYRVNYTEQPVHLPLELKASSKGMTITFSGTLDPQSAVDSANYSIKTWSLKRTKGYGSKHFDEKPAKILGVKLLPDAKTISIDIAEMSPTWCMEISYSIKSAAGQNVQGVINNTIHQFNDASPH